MSDSHLKLVEGRRVLASNTPARAVKVHVDILFKLVLKSILRELWPIRWLAVPFTWQND